MNNGRCSCGSVTWELLAEPYAMYNCHCRMCQKAHGTAFGTYCFVRPGQIRWTSSTNTIVHYESSEVLVRSSCDVCGSVVPYANEADNHWVAPGGCHDEMRKSDYNIFVADNSPWHTINGHMPRLDTYPTESGLPTVEGRPVCQWRSKKGPPWRCKKGPLGGCGLVPVVHGRAPRATRRALNRPTRRRAREGPVGPWGQAWVGWSVQFAVGV